MPERTGADVLLPTGAVTFLLTDIEGSTALWEQHPDAMRVALARHDRLLRRAIEASAGCIVKNTGDGVLAVFAAAPDALAACLAAQRALQAQAPPAPPGEVTTERGAPIALRVRMGLHTGVAEFRDADCFGASLNRAARIMSAAHGGQVLVSAATAELVRAHLPDGVTLREMGEHRLKGLLDPETLLQVVAPDLRGDFPPLASLTGYRLPAERDPFVGRLEPLAELARRLDAGARLVCVVGLGGIGKTRFVTRFGWRSLGEFPGGVWFCDLAEARSLEGVVHAVAKGLDVPLGNDDPVRQLGLAIAGRGKCLVILDNLEQVARYAQETLGRWLDRGSDARFLVTTREVLGLPGEEVLALPPMAPPDAATLFMRRAEAAKPAFEPNADDQAAVIPLVKLLEGLPLAIELAAARVRVMPPRTLLARMSERFKLLASLGGRVDRQATLRAVFDWSWGLLSLPEKAALAQLSVFEGGFTLASVEAVLDLSTFEPAPWPMDALQSLVQKSLVRQVTDDRFDLLVSVQEYVAEHLRTEERYPGSGPAALHAAQERHGRYFADLDESGATADSCAELDNLIAACRRAAARGDADVAANALQGAWAGLNLRGPVTVGIELVSAVRAIAGLGGATSARVDWIAGRVLEACGHNREACVEFEASLARARECGNRHCECNALISLGFRDVDAGRTDASRAHLEAGLVLARELLDRAMEGAAHNGLGILEEFLGRLPQAKAQYEAARVLARDAGDRQREGRLLGNLGGLCADEGNLEAAESHFTAALATARDGGDRRLEAITLGNLGWLERMQGRFDDALSRLESASTMARDIGLVHFECFVRLNLGLVYARTNRYDEARDNFDAALVVARRLGDLRSEGQLLSHLGPLHALRADVDQARDCLDSGEALLRAVSDQVGLGILLCCRVETEHLAGAPGQARAALARADAFAVSVAAAPESELGRALARVRSLVGNDGCSSTTRQ